jgi:hypothetical protein
MLKICKLLIKDILSLQAQKVALATIPLASQSRLGARSTFSYTIKDAMWLLSVEPVQVISL